MSHTFNATSSDVHGLQGFEMALPDLSLMTVQELAELARTVAEATPPDGDPVTLQELLELARLMATQRVPMPEPPTGEDEFVQYARWLENKFGPDYNPLLTVEELREYRRIEALPYGTELSAESVRVL